jgi:hypothetical protein
MNMIGAAKFVFMCSLFYDGFDEYEAGNYLDHITIYETAEDQGNVELISYTVDQLKPQTKWYVDYEYKTTYKVSEGGNYYFQTFYKRSDEDEDKLEINETLARIEYAIDPETLKYKNTFIKITDGVEDKNPEPYYGYCVPVSKSIYKKLD